MPELGFATLLKFQCVPQIGFDAGGLLGSVKMDLKHPAVAAQNDGSRS